MRCRYENKYEVSKYKYESHKISSQYKYIYNYYKLLNPKLITHHHFECSVRLEKAQYKYKRLKAVLPASKNTLPFRF